MIRASDLVSSEGRRRYDENGDPLYTTTERVLMAARWLGWFSIGRLFEALELVDASTAERARYQATVYRLVDHGRIEARGKRGLWREYRLALMQPAIVEKRERDYDDEGNVVRIRRQTHTDSRPKNYAQNWRQKRHEAGLCVACPGRVEDHRYRCAACRAQTRAWKAIRRAAQRGQQDQVRSADVGTSACPAGGDAVHLRAARRVPGTRSISKRAA